MNACGSSRTMEADASAVFILLVEDLGSLVRHGSKQANAEPERIFDLLFEFLPSIDAVSKVHHTSCCVQSHVLLCALTRLAVCNHTSCCVQSHVLLCAITRLAVCSRLLHVVVCLVPLPFSSAYAQVSTPFVQVRRECTECCS